jgi:hypothetical protein
VVLGKAIEAGLVSRSAGRSEPFHARGSISRHLTWATPHRAVMGP